MINTIFWFADDIDQYNHELTTQGISDKTIVFIKDSGEIFVNNKKYGRTLEDIFNDPEVDTIFNDDSVLKQQVQDMIDALRRDHNRDIAQVIETINTNKNTQSSDKDALNDKIDNTKTAVDGRVDGVIEELNTAKTNINSRIDNVESDITDINTTLDYVSDRTLVANAGLNINSVGTPSITVTKDAVNNREILTFNYLKGEPGQPGKNFTYNDFTQEQLNSLKGTPGIPGNDGNDGKTPYIQNGYWYIDGVNTGVKARGEDGIDGKTPYIQNGYWYIDGVSTGVEVGGNVTPYDDSSIRQSIQDIIDELEELKNGSSTPGTQGPGGMTQEELARIDELEQNLQTLSDTVDALNLSSGGMTSEEIQDFIDNAIATSDDLLNLIKEHGIDNISTWSGWNDKLNGYLQGYVVGQYTDSNGSSNVTLSQLLQKVNQLRSEVTYISSSQGGEGPSTEVIQNMIDQSIENNTSITQIKNKYAFEHDDVMEWLGSGFEAQVSPNGSFAQMYANGMSNISGQITNATAGLRSEIQANEDGIITGALNSLVSEYSGGDITTMSGLVSKANNSISESDLVASLNNTASQAHLAVKATADSATTDMLSEYGIDSKTKISTLASDLASEINARTQLGTSVTSISQKVDRNGSAIEGVVDASTGKITASKIWNALASDTSVKSAMRSEFATTVDGEGIASIVKEDIAQDFDQTSWSTYIAYMKGGIDSLSTTNATVTSLQQTVNANQAILSQFAAYGADLDNLKDAQDHVTALSIATQIANNTSAVNTLSAKFKPTSNEIATAVETQLNASAAGGNWTSFAQQIANDHTTIGSINTRVGTLESKNIVETSMISKVTGNDGKISAASIVTAINADTESNVYISADRITMTGNTTFINGIKNIVGQTNIDGGKITTGTISASRIDTDNLTVNAANISGKLTASQIDATNLTVKAANVQGTLTASQITGSTIADAINGAGSSILIDADHINFNGYAVFTNQGFKQEVYDILDDEYDIGAIATTAGNAATVAANAAKVVNTIYRSSNSSSSPSLPSQFVTDSTGGQGIWTTVRPEYNANYPYLFKSIQTKRTDDTATFSPAYLDKTTTVINGSSITTGTISADRLDVSAIVGKINSSTGNSAIKINADRVDFTGSITASGLTAGGLKVDKTTTRTQSGVNLTTNYKLETASNGDLFATLTKQNLIGNTIDTDYIQVFEFNSDGSGWIAGSTIGWDTYGNVMICEDGDYPTHFNSDGSGYIAGTGITWDIDGNLKLTNATLSGTTTFVGVTDSNDIRRYTDISGDTIKCTDLDENTRFQFNASVTGNNYNLTVEGTSNFNGNVNFTEDVAISGDAYIEGNLDISGNFSHGSDARRKDIKAYNINPTIENIANAPAIRFTWEGKENDSLHLGTTAQYWQNILPEAIKEYKDGTLGLEYDTVALLSVITAAKEIVALKQEIADLKTQLNIA